MKTTLATLFLLMISSIAFAQVPVTVDLVSIASGFDKPVDIANAGDDRLFIVEKDGLIRILRPDGSIDATPFLDMQTLTSTGGFNSERGLLGLAFHPDYDENGYLYVNYTRPNWDTRISRFTVSANPDLADETSREDILTIDQPDPNHNGGCLKFGPDGYLYIGMGDGGGAGDLDDNAQNINSLLGKMLRIDVDNGLPYSIPDDNPFVGQAPLDEIWAIGLRNPWRFSFDSLTDDLWIGDVGQGQWEEIDYQPASSIGGENYGWRCYEGLHAFNTTGCEPMSAYDDPIAEYAHGTVHCSVTGGTVYRGTANLDMQGKYFCVDYCSGQFWSMEQNDADDWLFEEVTGFEGLGYSAFGVDEEDELYVANQNTGIIFKIVDEDCVGFTPSITVAGTALTASPGIFYEWYLNGEAIEGENSSTLDVTVNGDYSVAIETSNGCYQQSASVSIQVPIDCTADLNGDGFVDVNDFLIFNSAFGNSCESCPEDLDGNGTVDVNDFLALNSEFGSTCN